MTTTTVAKPGVTYTPPTAAAPRSRTARRRALALVVIILTAAAVAVGTWLIVARVARGSATPVAAAPAVATWTPIASPSARTARGDPPEEATRARGLFDQGRRHPRPHHEIRAGRLPSARPDPSAQPIPRERTRGHRDHRLPQPGHLEQPLRPPPSHEVRRASPHRPRRPARREREPSCAARGDPQPSMSKAAASKNAATGLPRRRLLVEAAFAATSAPPRRLRRCPSQRRPQAVRSSRGNVMTHDQPESPSESPSGSRAARVWIFLQLFSLTCGAPAPSGKAPCGQKR